jgi:NADPH-dependent 2,4-dienoyl-CoA reductase/sulfur reductase-like enzyme
VNAGVVIVGGGLAGQRCAEMLRRLGYGGGIRMICAEPRRPYDRPPLSKEALAGSGWEPAFLRTEDWYEENGVELLLGARATALHPDEKWVALAGGGQALFEQLVIATGSRPRELPALRGRSNVSVLRTIEDAAALRAVVEQGGSLAVIGAGFVGLEVAATARSQGLEVTVIEAGPAPLARVLGPQIGSWFAAMHRDEGADVLLDTQVARIEGGARVESLVLTNGRTVRCDHVLVGIGSDPDLDWVAGSGLDVTGIPVDAAGRSAIPNVFAAGDAAATYDAVAGRRVICTHWEAAARQGARVARAIVGREPGEAGLSSFWSDQYGTRIQYLGNAELADDVSVDGAAAGRDFTAVYSRAGRPVAALLVGRPHALPEARRILAPLAEGAST